PSAGGGDLSGTVTFTVNGKPISPALTATLNGTSPQMVSADLVLDKSVVPNGTGTYPVKAIFAPGAGNKYLGSDATSSAYIAKEHITLDYTGQTFVSTSRVGGTVGVQLSAKVTEDADGYLGNL